MTRATLQPPSQPCLLVLHSAYKLWRPPRPADVCFYLCPIWERNCLRPGIFMCVHAVCPKPRMMPGMQFTLVTSSLGE